MILFATASYLWQKAGWRFIKFTVQRAILFNRFGIVFCKLSTEPIRLTAELFSIGQLQSCADLFKYNIGRKYRQFILAIIISLKSISTVWRGNFSFSDSMRKYKFWKYQIPNTRDFLFVANIWAGTLSLNFIENAMCDGHQVWTDTMHSTASCASFSLNFHFQLCLVLYSFCANEPSS